MRQLKDTDQAVAEVAAEAAVVAVAGQEAGTELAAGEAQAASEDAVAGTAG